MLVLEAMYIYAARSTSTTMLIHVSLHWNIWMGYYIIWYHNLLNCPDNLSPSLAGWNNIIIGIRTEYHTPFWSSTCLFWCGCWWSWWSFPSSRVVKWIEAIAGITTNDLNIIRIGVKPAEQTNDLRMTKNESVSYAKWNSEYRSRFGTLVSNVPALYKSATVHGIQTQLLQNMSRFVLGLFSTIAAIHVSHVGVSCRR